MNSTIIVKIGIVATVTVGGIAALSHPYDRGIRHICTADAAVEP
ncbi:hypothetical protein [Shewanella decolorationis]|nr:hypothetical protein [Shewanella decolorationis]